MSTNVSVYKSYSKDKMEELLSQFLIDSWSYSKVSAFARHQKAFEMSYIYGYRHKNSASSVAGSAYHAALEAFFISFKNGDKPDLASLEITAFDYIENVKANEWKLQKTTPTINDCKTKALSTVNSLLRNFYSELSTYESDIEEILDVEVYCDEFLNINGVDIPLPCHAKIDLVFRSYEGQIVIVDHKSKNAFSSEKEMALGIGTQAITYIKCFEEKTNIKVDEVWFVENKFSQNRDKGAQLNCFKLRLTADTRRLYEALLYEPLRSMIEAVHNPDHVYLINESDNYVDIEEIYEFWAKTMIAEVEEFNIVDSKKEIVGKRLKKIRDSSMAMVNPKVIKEFKSNASTFIQYDLSDKNMTQEQKIEHVLRSFSTIVRVAHKFDGYSSNTFLLEVSAGVKIASIHSHKLDIANALDVPTVRISRDLMVYEGKSYLPIDFSKKRDKTLEFDPAEVSGLKIPLGKDNFGNTIHWDLNNQSTPHMLVCGATGSGKSVSLKSTIEYAKLAGVTEIILLDPKYEFLHYAGSDSVKVFNEIEEIETVVRDLVAEMNHRVKNQIHQKTLVIFDEFADAVAASKKGNELNIYEDVPNGMSATGLIKTKRECTGTLKSLEENLKILLQKGRSSGFRIIAATQRASVKVITGDAKVNFPVQICFRVPKATDSRVVIDEDGAESLMGAGDGLIKSPDYPEIVRFQAFYAN